MTHLVDGVVRGIGDYGNCVGVPTVGGEVDFHPSYNGNILVNAMCVGVARADGLFFGRASGAGNRVVYLGSKTGRDGIHGATMASDVFDETASEKRPTVQVGDPFTEKLLIECCLELMGKGLVVGIQDMGAAGLTSSAFEMAARAGCGLTLDLSLVPAREKGMTPYELMLSESQERMLLVVSPASVPGVLDVCHRWGLDAVEIGSVTAEPEVIATFDGREAFRLPVAPLVDDAPRYERPWVDPTPASAVTLPPLHERTWGADLRAMLSSPPLRRHAHGVAAVRPIGRRQHGGRAGGGCGAAAAPRHEHRHRRHDRLQRPRLWARSTERSGPGGGRGRPQPGVRGRRAGRGHGLPQLRLARKPKGHGAVRRRSGGNGGGVPGLRGAGGLGKRVVLQRDLRQRNLAHAHRGDGGGRSRGAPPSP